MLRTPANELVEDIYGRLRTKSGAVVASGAYVPPALRSGTHSADGVDEKKRLQLQRMSKQLKGLINRSNSHYCVYGFYYRYH